MISINIEFQYRDMIACSILQLAKEHKSSCTSSECGVVFFPFRDICKQLLERELTEEEYRILS